MRNKITLTICFLFFAFSAISSNKPSDGIIPGKYATLAERYRLLSSFFEDAYSANPAVPRGILESISWSKTRMRQIVPGNETSSCAGLPSNYGVMGLVKDGKSYFKNTLYFVSNRSGISTDDLEQSAELSIFAFARTFADVQQEMGISSASIEDNIPVLELLTELPSHDDGQKFAVDCEVYEILTLLSDMNFCALIGIAQYQINFNSVFGKENLNVLSSSKILITKTKIFSKKGVYSAKKKSLGSGNPKKLSSDYAPALWNAAASCNYTVGRSQAISAVTIHTVQGTYAGCISWFKNCSASVSAHYVIRSSDGQVTQMVLESNKAWHVGSENPYTIGYEHEGYVNDPSWYTTAMYSSSADLSKDVCNSGYGINPQRTGFWPWLATTYYNQSSIPGSCVKIKGHMHFPNQTHSDPGPNWNWDYYFKLINDNPTTTTYTTSSGTLYDSGGGGGNYTNDERNVYVISPSGATSVTLTFTSFSLENTWDYIYIYEGNSVWSPLIGYYTGTNSPGTVTSNNSSITVEFRSDCSTVDAGWVANWTGGTSTVTPTNLSVSPAGCPGIGVTLNWTNSGSGWVVDVTTDASFTTFYNKDVSNLSSVVCPGGFCDYPNCTNYLQFQPNTTYYWRIWDGTAHTYGQPFTTPDCSGTDPSCSGSFYDSGGQSGSYSGNEDYSLSISPAFATAVTMTFTAFDLENGYDFIYIFNGPDTLSPLIGTYTGTTSPGTVIASSGSMTIRFISDPFVNNSGWAATWACTQNNTPPTTSVSATGNWQTQNFTASFTDVDMNASGLDLLFYQPLEYNGIEWRANNGNGFFNDNFDLAIHPDWTQSTGTWAINSGYMNQTDELLSNTNIYAPLTQVGTEKYLYQWGMNMGGGGTNRRAGLHFFCDNPSLDNRGNSYFVWFRADNDKCQIYEVINDTFYLMVDSPVVINTGTWYDCKVIYDPASGVIKAFLNNQLVAQWTDASPIASGNSISLRTGNANVFYNNLKVYRARAGNTVNISVGTAATNDIRYQNPDPATPACRIKSIVKDNYDLWSSPATLNVNVDWSPPLDVYVNDGLTWDLDTVYVTNELSANWTNSADTNSDVAGYWYTIGSSAGDSDVVSWTNNGLNTSVTVTGLSLNYGQYYYYSVNVENGAGLFSNEIASDGAYVALLPSANFSPSSSVICEGDSVSFTNYSLNALTHQWTFTGGNPATSSAVNPVVLYSAAGVFAVRLVASNTNGNDTITDYITVNENPSVSAAITDAGCNGSPDGSIDLTVNGGTPPYSYSWTNGQSNSTATALIPGNYGVTVDDSNGCNLSSAFIVNDHLVSAGFIQSADTINLSVSDSVTFTDQSTGASSWQWDFGDGNNSTLQNPVAHYDSVGVFMVMLVAGDGSCYDSAYSQVVVELITFNATNENNNSLKVFLMPNPFTEKTILSISGFEKISRDLSVEINDLTGKLLIRVPVMNGYAEISRGNLRAGLYFYCIKREGQIAGYGKLAVE